MTSRFAETSDVLGPGPGERTIAVWLRDKADSYWRDARTLDQEGDSVMAVAYWAIAAELRRCADAIGEAP